MSGDTLLSRPPSASSRQPLAADPRIDLGSDSAQARVVRLVGEGRRVLELGCTSGSLSQALRERGCEVVALGSDQTAVAAAAPHCRRALIGDLDVRGWETALAGERFEVVVVADLEQSKDPVETLAAARRLLVPGGLIVASVPNAAQGSVRRLRSFTLQRPRETAAAASLASEMEALRDTEAELCGLILSAHEMLFARDEALRAAHEAVRVAQEAARAAQQTRVHTPEPAGRAELEALRSLLFHMRRTRVWRAGVAFWRLEARVKRLLGRPTNGWPPV